MTRTKFSYDAGGGLRYFFSKHVGIRVQARYVPTYLYSTPSAPQCYTFTSVCSDKKEHDLNQGEVSLGFVIRM